ncbi:UPF0149 family protein [Geomonas sp. RF6]|uniref:UPF0149 family protein n=1 Tax=Geomonas sp. RF6 TaxID=2897342 RepID=UPI001E48C3EF|nr:UPF0149 family protein [Geomonas sp. RF6]UFS68673.1 UPF0149 family protein [Geomonas sp. RF6]
MRGGRWGNLLRDGGDAILPVRGIRGDKPIFTVEEREKLSDLLARAVNPDEALTVEGLHGFLFGLAITPEPVMPSEWLPQVFGEAVADFASNVDANETLEYLFGAYHRICILNEQDLLYFPFDMETLKEDDLERIGEWAYGLYAAMCLRLNVWGIDERVVTELEMSDEDRYLSASCSVVLGVAVPESVPELFEDARQADMGTITAILYAALPEAVSTLRDHARKVRKTLSYPPYDTEELIKERLCPCGSGKSFGDCCGK